MTYTALIPVKALADSKSRLAPYLSQRQREEMVLDMLDHVLSVLLESRLLTRVSVVSPDRQVLWHAANWGAYALLEEVRGHNPALHAAALRELHAGVTALLTISTDLPLLSVDDIRALFEQSRRYPVVLAPSRDGTGTNAILLRPPLALPYLFGPHSLQRYQLAARHRHLSNIYYRSTGLGFDIDTIDDLRDLRTLHHESRYEMELTI